MQHLGHTLDLGMTELSQIITSSTAGAHALLDVDASCRILSSLTLIHPDSTFVCLGVQDEIQRLGPSVDAMSKDGVMEAIFDQVCLTPVRIVCLCLPPCSQYSSELLVHTWHHLHMIKAALTCIQLPKLGGRSPVTQAVLMKVHRAVNPSLQSDCLMPCMYSL